MVTAKNYGKAPKKTRAVVKRKVAAAPRKRPQIDAVRSILSVRSMDAEERICLALMLLG